MAVTNFTKNSKELDRERPFHRINSPWFKEEGEIGKTVKTTTGQDVFLVGHKSPPEVGGFRADGRGYECGCRSIQDMPDRGFAGNFKLSLLRFVGAVSGLGDPREVLHTMPGWVPVLNKKPMSPTPQDDVDNPTQVEFEGVLERSFLTWTDAPGAQWHQWYDWNFLVVPDPGFAYLKGAGNTPPEVEDEDKKKGFAPLIGKSVMQLEWDCGAISASRPGPMFDGFLVKPDGAVDKEDPRWFWPMKGHYLWGTGRWIYDCGHSNPPDNKKKGLMRTEIHPVKALASARWEAVKFEENEHFVPAIQFMFFMHRKSGYKEWARLNDVDYEFIVDLPPLDIPQDLDWQIGHTPEFAFNTGVLRTPHLLKKIRFMEIPNVQTPGKVMPTVEPFKLASDGPNAAPKQVIVKIPCTQLPASADYFGFVLSLGWHDPDNVLARGVKKCSVDITRFHVGANRHEGPINPTAEWELRVGVNGRWMQTVLYEGVKEFDTKEIDVAAGKSRVELHLAEEDALLFNAHGQELDPVGDFLREKSVAQRTLKKNGVPAQWEKDIVIKDGNKDVINATVDAIGDLMSSTLGIQNDPLGMIDPGTLSMPDEEKKHNPLTMKSVTDGGGRLGDKDIKLTAWLTKEVGKLAELAERKGDKDYELHFTVNVDPQKVGKS